MDKFLKSFGCHINRLRVERQLTFQEMSLRCNIEKASLVRLTRNGTNITMATLYRISKGLDIPLIEIFDFEY